VCSPHFIGLLHSEVLVVAEQSEASMKFTVWILLGLFVFCSVLLFPSANQSFPQSAKVTTPDSTPQIPDTIVLDQNGKRLRFYSDLVKGKTVAINFIFTSCTTICPPLTATFRRVQTQLEKEAGPSASLISVSVDPTTDVPERLKDYAAKFKAGPGWTFVTGEKTEIDKLLAALGAAVADKSDHTPMILIGNDSAGYWTREYGLSAPSQLVGIIKGAAERKAFVR
jgi:protein SCO1